MSTQTTQAQFRRGNSAFIAAFAGASGEINVNTDTCQVVVQDGLGTFGGWTGARIVDLRAVSGVLQAQISTGGGGGGGIAPPNIAYLTGVQIITGQTSFASGIYDLYNNKSIDTNNHLLNNYTGISTIDYSNCLLYFAAQPVFNWQIGIVYDNNIVFGQQQSINTNNRILSSRPTNSTIQTSIDWQNSILSGNWNIQSGLFYENIGYNFITTGSNTLNTTHLSNKPYYINTGISGSTMILPQISSNIGRQYIVKNKGAGITLSGTYPDNIFSYQRVINFTINSGESYTIINDGIDWCLN